MEHIENAGVLGGVDATGTGYVEHLRRPDLSLGTYSLRAAHEVHRFHDITEDLSVLVFFGPAEGARQLVPGDGGPG